MKTEEIIYLVQQVLNRCTSLFGYRMNYIILIPRIDTTVMSKSSFVPEIYVFQLVNNSWVENISQQTTEAPMFLPSGIQNFVYQISASPRDWKGTFYFISSIVDDLIELFSFLNIPFDKPILEMKEAFLKQISNGTTFAMITPDLQLYHEVGVNCTFGLSGENGKPENKQGASSVKRDQELFRTDLTIKEKRTFTLGF